MKKLFFGALALCALLFILQQKFGVVNAAWESTNGRTSQNCVIKDRQLLKQGDNNIFQNDIFAIDFQLNYGPNYASGNLVIYLPDGEKRNVQGGVIEGETVFKFYNMAKVTVEECGGNYWATVFYYGIPKAVPGPDCGGFTVLLPWPLVDVREIAPDMYLGKLADGKIVVLKGDNPVAHLEYSKAEQTMDVEGLTIRVRQCSTSDGPRTAFRID